MSEEVTIYCDGLCEPNPCGHACIGWVAVDGAGDVLAKDSDCLGAGPGMTNNVAEYEAVLEGLRWAYGKGHTHVHIKTDSKLVVNQVTGEWDCTAPGLLPLLAKVRRALDLMEVTFEWIPRAENAEADALSKYAFKAVTGRPPREWR